MSSGNENYASLGIEDGYDTLEDPATDGLTLNPLAAATETLLAKSSSTHSVSTTTTNPVTENTLQGASDTASDSGESEADELFGLDEQSTNLEKIIILSKQSAPVIMSFFLGLLGSFINLLFAGRFVPTHGGDRSIVFAGISLANMFANVSCLSLLIGMSSAVETLGSQHNGAGMCCSAFRIPVYGMKSLCKRFLFHKFTRLCSVTCSLQEITKRSGWYCSAASWCCSP